jgi:hypothetical protein
MNLEELSDILEPREEIEESAFDEAAFQAMLRAPVLLLNRNVDLSPGEIPVIRNVNH